MDMQIPNVPTDNLYKFISISGLVLIVTSFIAISISQREVADQIFTTHQEALSVGKAIQQLDDEMDALVSNPTPESYVRAKQILEETKPLEVELAKLESMNDKSEYMHLASTEDLNFFKNQIYFGFFLTILGFIGWYYRLQRHLDAIVKKEAEG
jgi:hypothetical protein